MVVENAQNILDFWFKESLPEELFRQKDSFDKKIRDQFSRNLFRNDKKAFDQDHKCRLIVNEAIDRGDLEKFSINEKLFFLLPLLHSEEISDHAYVNNLSHVHLKNHPQIGLIKSSWKDHTDVIKKFKRYPHRNKVLDRQSTAEEIEFLRHPNSSW